MQICVGDWHRSRSQRLPCLFVCYIFNWTKFKAKLSFPVLLCHDHAILLSHIFFNPLAISAVGCIETTCMGWKLGEFLTGFQSLHVTDIPAAKAILQWNDGICLWRQWELWLLLGILFHMLFIMHMVPELCILCRELHCQWELLAHLYCLDILKE